VRLSYGYRFKEGNGNWMGQTVKHIRRISAAAAVGFMKGNNNWLLPQHGISNESTKSADG